MLLSNKEILKYREDGYIVIEPFDERQLGTNSYDCRLGEWYYQKQPGVVSFSPFRDEEEVKRFWGEAKQAQGHKGIQFIAIPPAGSVLAHTQEFIGGRTYVTTSMRTRSTIARSCIDVCGSAGLGDVGYVGRWTMELHNRTSDTWIYLPVGIRICQIEFFWTGSVINEYQGKYSNFTEADWKPENMLPKGYKDYDNPYRVK